MSGESLSPEQMTALRTLLRSLTAKGVRKPRATYFHEYDRGHADACRDAARRLKAILTASSPGESGEPTP